MLELNAFQQKVNALQNNIFVHKRFLIRFFHQKKNKNCQTRQKRDARHVRRMSEKFKRLGLGLRVRESVDSDSAEIVSNGNDPEFL